MSRSKLASTTGQPPARGDGSSVDRLIEAAETLYGRHGVDGVSLRQIGAAAGSSNNFAVQYHFGDAAGLIQAILRKRMPAVDARQDAMLAELEAGGRLGDTRALIDAFLRPLLEQRNSRGERAYARFISALLRSPDGVEHCRALFHLTPSAGRIQTLLRAANPDLQTRLLQERLRLLSIMVCTSVFNRLPGSDDPQSDAALIDDAIGTAAAGLSSPSV